MTMEIFRIIQINTRPWTMYITIGHQVEVKIPSNAFMHFSLIF